MPFKKRSTPRPDRAISREASNWKGRGCLIAFCSVFVFIGLGAFYGLFLRPVWSIQAAKDWRETPCVILSSKVGEHRNDKGKRTYSVDITYRYTVGGQQYESDRYNFLGGSSSGRASKAAAVARYPVGAERICYVDPAEPSEAVLMREFTGDMWFGLIPLVFVLFGALGIAAGAGLFGSGSRAKQAWLPKSKRAGLGATAAATSEDGPLTLRPKSTRGCRLVGTILFTLFWNGIISVFLYQVFDSWREGDPEYFLTVFMIPFVLVGMGGVGACVYMLLAMANPRVTLTLSQPVVTLGGTMLVEWKFSGRTHVLQRLRIELRGEENATYRRGTKTYTDTNCFAELQLVDVFDPLEILSGVLELRIPDDTMHTFEASNNKINWAIHVRGEIRRWPDVSENFPLVVHPHPMSV